MSVKAERTDKDIRWSAKRVNAALDTFYRMYDGVMLIFEGSVSYPGDLKLSFDELGPFDEESAQEEWCVLSAQIGAFDDSADPEYDPEVEGYLFPQIASLYLGVLDDGGPPWSVVKVEAPDREAVRALLALVDS